MKTLKCLFPMLFAVSILVLIEGCYTSFAIPREGFSEQNDEETAFVSSDSVAGPGLVYSEERYADENCDPGVRIIIVQRPSWIVYDDPWDDWYYGYGWFDWYGGNWYSKWYDPWMPCTFVPTPVVWHPWGWGDHYYAHSWRHSWAYDPWPDYHHASSKHYSTIRSNSDYEKRTFARREPIVATRTAGRQPVNSARIQSTPATHRPAPATQGVSSPESRNVGRRRPEVIRDIRHDTPAARPAEAERHPLSAPQKSEEPRTVRPESRRNPVSNRGDVRPQTPVVVRTVSEKQEERSPVRPARSDRRVGSASTKRVANEPRPASDQSARSSQKRSSEKSVQATQPRSSSNRDSNGPVRRDAVSRPTASASHSVRNPESGSSKRGESGSERRSRR